jgi:hypothetical protein
MAKFIPGIELSRRFYEDAVKPILAANFPDLKYSAALIGWGSEVLGYDTAMSRDHHWGPRMILFLEEVDFSPRKEKIDHALSVSLPYEFMGYSTNYSLPEPNGVRHLVKITEGPVDHMIVITTIKDFFKARLGVDPLKKLTVTDWLTFPRQRLLVLTGGAVYHDGLGTLEKARAKLKYYPRDIWLYLLAAQWTKISQEEAFVGRAGDVGDELGSQVIAARLVREIMNLCFLMEREYAPYSKWFGTAFSNLKIAGKLGPVLRDALLAADWKSRERALAKAYSIVARAHNALKITGTLPVKASKYFGRPYMVIHGDAFAEAIFSEIKDPEVKRIKAKIGSVDQFTDSTDVAENVALCRKLGIAYE